MRAHRFHLLCGLRVQGFSRSLTISNQLTLRLRRALGYTHSHTRTFSYPPFQLTLLNLLLLETARKAGYHNSSEHVAMAASH